MLNQPIQDITGTRRVGIRNIFSVTATEYGRLEIKAELRPANYPAGD